MPHEVPSGLLPAGVQTAAPLLHSMVCLAQLVATEQSEPALHATHPPASLHTKPASPPHAVPSGTLLTNAHTGAPVLHAYALVTHALGSEQSAPALQLTHPPSLHTIPLSAPPHDVPFCTAALTQTTAPPSHTYTPSGCWHPPGGVHVPLGGVHTGAASASAPSPPPASASWPETVASPRPPS